ncbi:GTP-binding protein Rhes-like [Bacillus rossius redtenbacheri]|uniref:GTP-binding protein Rhes-like n=1 Tax=Bacillus rossius redtenbacheri TaxID=93214 RepID=UPI002FDE63DD
MPGAGGRLRLPSLGADAGGGACQREQHRVVVMGAARVGKTSIIAQFLYDRFSPRYRETVEELHRGEYELQDGATLTLDILDTSGAFQFPAMRALSISTADGFLLVFAVDQAESWEEVRRLRAQILETRGPRVPIVVVGNKQDSPARAVPRELAEAVALFEWECGYVECSAKDNCHIVDVFKELLAQAKVRYNLSPAVRRRRQSLPTYASSAASRGRHMLKRNSCTVA